MIQRPNRKGGGFSLVELLVVVLIISILMALGASTLRGLNVGKGVSSAVVTIEALLAETRATAIGNGTKARLLIDVNDPKDTDNYLRRMFIVYQEVNSSSSGDPSAASSGRWVMGPRASLLPEKIFFSRAFSKRDQKSDGAPIEEMVLSADKVHMNGTYLFYEFNSQGICTSPGASFIVGSGARNSGDEPRVTGGGKRDFGGVVIWRNGGTSVFRDIGQMDLPGQITTF